MEIIQIKTYILSNTDHSLTAHEQNNYIIKTIMGLALKKCNLDDGLCHVNFFETNSDEAPLCSKYLFLQKTTQGLNKVGM